MLLQLRKLITRGRAGRAYHDYVRFSTPGGLVRLPLSNQKILGIATSRGIRGHQEDFYAFATLQFSSEELRLDVKQRHNIDWDPTLVSEVIAGQTVFIGIYDGHGGSAVSQFLRQELHGLMESANPNRIPELFEWVKEIGGYFKRFRGGALEPWIHPKGVPPPLSLEARATQTFFERMQIDRHLSNDPVARKTGATASVAILHALDAPGATFFNSKKLALTVAHCGDTRVILCSTKDGTAFPMTDNHHPDALGESIRLRRMMGSALVTDAFGENRWMGALANTRCLGDLAYKRFGITPEPEVRTKLLEDGEWAYMVMFSDGISSQASDDEIVSLARNMSDPKAAADRILAYAEEMGGEDNATCIVVPLSGWGQVQGPDITAELRNYRRQQAVGSERQRRM